MAGNTILAAGMAGKFLFGFQGSGLQQRHGLMYGGADPAAGLSAGAVIAAAAGEFSRGRVFHSWRRTRAAL